MSLRPSWPAALSLTIASIASAAPPATPTAAVPGVDHAGADKIDDLLQLREGYLAVGKFQEAIETSNKLIELRPNDGVFYYLRGEVYSRTENYQSAVLDYEKALALDHGDLDKQPPFFFNIGTAYLNWGKNQEAITYFDKALNLDKRFADALARRGAAYYNLERLSLASGDLDRALKLDPRNGVAYYYRALIYARSDDFQNAVRDFTRCLELEPETFNHDARLFQVRGEALRTLKKPQEALSDLNRALAINPRYPLALVSRGCVFMDLREYESSLRDLDAAVALEPTNDVAFFWRGSVYYSTGRLSPALADFTRVIDLNPGNIVAQFLVAEIYSQQHDEKRACQCLERAVGIAKKTDFPAQRYLEGSVLFEDLRKASCFGKLVGN